MSMRVLIGHYITCLGLYIAGIKYRKGLYRAGAKWLEETNKDTSDVLRKIK